MTIPTITIDGPSGSGKGTISELVAEKLGWYYLDSGAIYRVLALVVISDKIQLDDLSALVNRVETLKVEFVNKKIILEKEDITAAIRSEECGIVASKIATIAQVRTALISFFQEFGKLPGLVADGRDMGTVVFPKAKLKIFLTASVEERARRRLLQLQEKGISATLDNVLQALMERDARDENRDVSPLKPDTAAVIIDTTKLSIDEVVQLVLAHVEACS